MLGSQGQHVRAPGDQGLLVGQTDVLASLDGCHSGLQACKTPKPAILHGTLWTCLDSPEPLYTCLAAGRVHCCMLREGPAATAGLEARVADPCSKLYEPRAASPAQPTMPVMTASASGWVATSQMPWSPATISGCGCTSLIISLSSATFWPDLSQHRCVKKGRRQWTASPGSGMYLIATSLGLTALICSARSSRLDPAARATTSNRSACSATISRVCRPADLDASVSPLRHCSAASAHSEEAKSHQ